MSFKKLIINLGTGTVTGTDDVDQAEKLIGADLVDDEADPCIVVDVESGVYADEDGELHEIQQHEDDIDVDDEIDEDLDADDEDEDSDEDDEE